VLQRIIRRRLNTIIYYYIIYVSQLCGFCTSVTVCECSYMYASTFNTLGPKSYWKFHRAMALKSNAINAEAMCIILYIIVVIIIISIIKTTTTTIIYIYIYIYTSQNHRCRCRRNTLLYGGGGVADSAALLSPSSSPAAAREWVSVYLLATSFMAFVSLRAGRYERMTTTTTRH